MRTVIRWIIRSCLPLFALASGDLCLGSRFNLNLTQVTVATGVSGWAANTLADDPDYPNVIPCENP